MSDWTQQEQALFVAGLQKLARILPRARGAAEFEPEDAKVYLRALHDLPPNKCMAAMAWYAGNGKFFPRPVDFRERIEGNVEARHRALAEAGWMQVRALLNEGYGYRYAGGVVKAPPKEIMDQLPASAIRALAQLGGLSALAEQDEGELERWTHRRFVEACSDIEANPAAYESAMPKIEAKPNLAKLIHEATKQTQTPASEAVGQGESRTPEVLRQPPTKRATPLSPEEMQRRAREFKERYGKTETVEE